MMEIAERTEAFGAFFARMNPFVNLPIFLAVISAIILTVGQ